MNDDFVSADRSKHDRLCASYSEVTIHRWQLDRGAETHRAPHDVYDASGPATRAGELPASALAGQGVAFWSMLFLLAALGAGLAILPERRPALTAAIGGVDAVQPAKQAAILPVAAQTQTQYRQVWVTEMRERRVKTSRPQWTVAQHERRETLLRPVWITTQREETYSVQRPVVETAVRYEKVQVERPVTTYRTEYTDQGTWTAQQVAVQPRSSKQLRWVSGGWTVDSASGLRYWRLPGLQLVQVPAPAAQANQRVWKPQIVARQVPETKMVALYESRPVETQRVRYVTEQRTRVVPVRVCQLVEHPVVRRVGVVHCKMIDEERIEQVPVRVCRQMVIPSHPAAGPAAPVLDQGTDTSPSVSAPPSSHPQSAPPDQAPERPRTRRTQDSQEPLDPATIALR